MLMRWIPAAAALLAGTCVSVGLLVYANPETGARDFYVAAHDLPAGAALDASALRAVHLRPPVPEQLLFAPAARAQLLRSTAAHDLSGGQLLQRGDVAVQGSARDRRLVSVPVKEMPPVAAGDSVDLLLIEDGGDRLTVSPFALGVPVAAVSGGALVLSVPSTQASAYVYAAAALRLAAAVSEKGSGPGAEGAVGSLEQAREALLR